MLHSEFKKCEYIAYFQERNRVTKMRKKTLLDTADQQELAEQAGNALRSGMWALPRTVAPLTDAEIAFMQTHTLDQLLATQNTSMSPLCQFLVQVVSGVASELSTQAFENVVKPSHAVVSGSKTDNTNQQPKTVSQHGDMSIKKTPTIPTHPTTSSHTKAHCDGICEQPQYAPGKNPEFVHMTKTAEGKLKGLVMKEASKALSDRITDPNMQRLYQGVSTSIGAAIKTASFMNKIEETNFVNATTELVKNTLIDKFASYSGKAVTQIITTANPAGLAMLISLTIKDVLTPTETAPASHDTRPAACLPAMPRMSALPELDPPYPTLRAPR